MNIKFPQIGRDSVNGLEVVHVHTKSPIVGLTIASKTGSHIETEDEYGWVHFLEHSLFQGTRSKSAEIIQKISHDIGGVYNAFTGHYEMCLEIEVPYYSTLDGMELIFDCFFRSEFTTDGIKKEKKIINEEINMYSNGIMELSREQLFDSLVGPTELSRSILGTSESIAKINKNNLQEFYNKTMNLNNVVFIYVGPESKDKILKMVEDISGYYKHLTMHNTQKVFSDLSPKLEASVVEVEIQRLVNPIAAIYTKLPGYNSFDVNLSVAFDCIVGPTNSVLFNTLREDLGLIYSLDCVAYSNPSHGILEISCSTSDPAKVVDASINILEDVHKNGIDPQLIYLVKNQMKADFLRSCLTPDSVRQFILSDIIFDDIKTFEEKYDEINYVSENLVNSHFSSNFDLTKIVPVIFIPKKNRNRILKILDKLK